NSKLKSKSIPLNSNTPQPAETEPTVAATSEDAHPPAPNEVYMDLTIYIIEKLPEALRPRG
uniref:Reverse transcriptase domain-containing protein n=1 Tax=Panagrellus redivivus TaxID=6233 RepID=A0A7E4V5B5_PANRE